MLQEDKIRQDGTRQDRTRQGRTRQDTRQGKTSQVKASVGVGVSWSLNGLRLHLTNLICSLKSTQCVCVCVQPRTERVAS